VDEQQPNLDTIRGHLTQALAALDALQGLAASAPPAVHADPVGWIEENLETSSPGGAR